MVVVSMLHYAKFGPNNHREESSWKTHLTLDRILSICSMNNGTFQCDCEVGYGGDTCELTPCSTCAAWDLIGPTGSNHATYDQRNSYCDSIGKDFIM